HHIFILSDTTEFFSLHFILLWTCPNFVSMTFKYLAMTFTWEEWGELDQAQKTLYREVMLETCGLLVSLGKAHLPSMWGTHSLLLHFPSHSKPDW
uniref:KRAB domain-containing protein n=1 Tax=Sus scrofa TaxID=9823 RepID=A0A8D0U1K9_PIG